jgi:acetylglutamate kinase
MNLTIQAIPPLAGGPALTRHLDAFVRELLVPDSDEMLDVTVRHGHGCESEDDDVHCDVRARLASGTRVTVSHAAPTVVQALHGAVGKLRESIRADAALELGM